MQNSLHNSAKSLLKKCHFDFFPFKKFLKYKQWTNNTTKALVLLFKLSNSFFKHLQLFGWLLMSFEESELHVGKSHCVQRGLIL